MMEKSRQSTSRTVTATLHSHTSCRNSSKARRIGAISSLLIGAVFTIWKIRSQLRDSRQFTLRNWIRKKHTSQRQLQATNRPVIYTFYAPILRFGKTSSREAKIALTDQQLLKVWKSSWSDAGFHPVVLALHHAQQHPYYQQYVDTLSSVTLLGAGGRNQEYNEYCFLRYIAMVTVGGGLLCDYDVMPLIGNQPMQPIDDENRFTVFQRTLNKAGAVPSLASGKASEWDRMAMLILQIAQTPPPEGGWSDMVALMEVQKQNPDTYILQNKVLGYQDVMQDPDTICQKTQSAWAIHLSHYDVLAMGHRVFDRPQVAQDFVATFNTNCFPHTKRDQGQNTWMVKAGEYTAPSA